MQVYGLNYPRQKAITEAIIADAIIDCSLPISIIENASFRHLLSVLDSKYQPITRSTVCSRIDDMVKQQKEEIKNKLEKSSWLSVTVNIWSDRQMRGFLGVTVHTFEAKDSTINLASYLLSCKRFTGSHTGERISDAFEGICDEYVVKNKLDYIICDNAANMKRAFTVCFQSDDRDVGSVPSSEAQELDDDAIQSSH